MGKITVESNLNEVMQHFYKQGEKAMKAVGMQAEDYAKALCPVGEENGGTLRNSITHGVLVGDGKVAAVIGTDVYYAPFVELGHAQQVGRFVPKLGKRLVKPFAPAYPFLRPAIENNLDELWGIMQREFNSD